MNEHQLQVTVAEYLDAVLDPSVFWTSIGHGGGGKIRGAQLKRAGMKAGVPDVLICWTPISFGPRLGWIELKTKTGSVSEVQRLTAARLSRLGHGYAVCRSLDEVIGTLKAWNVPSREAKQVAA